jgi:F-box/TPR repeat protein Pof3
VEEYKELGKRYYGRRDYEKALDAFTDGIDASVGRDIQLYDYRAATYDKLENAIAALADSRQMIRAFQTDARVC